MHPISDEKNGEGENTLLIFYEIEFLMVAWNLLDKVWQYPVISVIDNIIVHRISDKNGLAFSVST